MHLCLVSSAQLAIVHQHFRAILWPVSTLCHMISRTDVAILLLTLWLIRDGLISTTNLTMPRQGVKDGEVRYAALKANRQTLQSHFRSLFRTSDGALWQ